MGIWRKLYIGIPYTLPDGYWGVFVECRLTWGSHVNGNFEQISLEQMLTLFSMVSLVFSIFIGPGLIDVSGCLKLVSELRL